MNKFLLFLGFIFLGFLSTNLHAQENGVTNSSDDVYSALKPEDGKPMVFATEAEMQKTVPSKIEACKLAIRENLNTPSRVQYNRELIWRFENAVVKSDSQEAISTVEENSTSSIKPADGIPVSFFSQEELEKNVPLKVEKLKAAISSGEVSGDKLKTMQEQLWRFENATVVERK